MELCRSKRWEANKISADFRAITCHHILLMGMPRHSATVIYPEGHTQLVDYHLSIFIMHAFLSATLFPPPHSKHFYFPFRHILATTIWWMNLLWLPHAYMRRRECHTHMSRFIILAIGLFGQQERFRRSRNLMPSRPPAHIAFLEAFIWYAFHFASLASRQPICSLELASDMMLTRVLSPMTKREEERDICSISADVRYVSVSPLFHWVIPLSLSYLPPLDRWWLP